MKAIVALILVTTFLSCQKEPNTGGSQVVDNILMLSVLDNDRKDLLKSFGIDGLSKIKLYYLIDNKMELYYQSNLADPYGIRLIPVENPDDNFRLAISLYNDGTFGENSEAITYLDWGDGTIDTIVGSFFNDEHNQILTKFKFNNIAGDLKDKRNFIVIRDEPHKAGNYFKPLQYYP